jgi:hypothetical protein
MARVRVLRTPARVPSTPSLASAESAMGSAMTSLIALLSLRAVLLLHGSRSFLAARTFREIVNSFAGESIQPFERL